MLKDTLTITTMAAVLFMVENLIFLTLLILVVAGAFPRDWPPVVYLLLGVASWPADKYITPRFFDLWHYIKKNYASPTN